MKYNKTDWESGDLITSSKLNNIENALGDILGTPSPINVVNNVSLIASESHQGSNFYVFPITIPQDLTESITVIFDGVSYTCNSFSGPENSLCWGASIDLNYHISFDNFPFTINYLEDNEEFPWVVLIADNNNHTISIYNTEISDFSKNLNRIYLIKENPIFDRDYGHSLTVSYQDIEDAISNDLIPVLWWQGKYHFLNGMNTYDGDYYAYFFDFNPEASDQFISFAAENKQSLLTYVAPLG